MMSPEIRNISTPVLSRKWHRVFALLVLVLTLSVELCPQDIMEARVVWSRELPPGLSEISGMAGTDTIFYAINDSGNEPLIWILDRDFNVTGKLEVDGLSNTDWEELALLGNQLYIGDFGNNLGNRRDLKVYIVDIDPADPQSTGVEAVPFTYDRQRRYVPMPYSHPWDCEAMIVGEDGVILFSKDWPSRLCRTYRLDPAAGEQAVVAVDSVDAGFLVTGACSDPLTGLTWLCGYIDGETYIASCTTDREGRFTSNISKFRVEGLKKSQVESIFVRGDLVMIASERTGRKQAVYRIEITNRSDEKQEHK